MSEHSSRPDSVAAIGECMIELSRREGGWNQSFSGDTFNTLWAIRALLPDDAVTDFVSAFGQDPFSRQQLDFMSHAGIGVAASPIVEAWHPGLYAIDLKDGERSFTYWRDSSVARHLADMPAVLSQSLAGRTLIFLSGITLAILPPEKRAVLIAELAHSKENGATIAFDANYRPRLWSSLDETRQALAAILPLVDIALPTFDDEALMYGDIDPHQTADRLAAAGISEIVVKNGARDALAYHHANLLSVPVPQVVQPLDTTGAGDAFNGGYLAARMSGLNVAQSIAIGHAIAAQTVVTKGAFAERDDLCRAAHQIFPTAFSGFGLL